MAIEKMAKISIVLTRERLEEEEIKLISSEEFAPINAEANLNPEIKKRLNIKKQNLYESLYIKLEQFSQLTNYKPTFSRENIKNRLERSIEIEDLGNRLDSINQRLKKLLTEKSQLNKTLENYQKVLSYICILKNLEINLEDITNFEFLKFVFGRVPINYFDILLFSSEDLPILILDINRDRENVWIFVFSPPNLLKDTYKILHSAYFKEDILPEGYQGTPTELKTSLESNIELTKLAIEEKSLQIKKILYENREFIDEIYPKILALKRTHDLASFGAYSKDNNFFFLQGWTTENQSTKIEKKLKKDTVIIKTPAQKIPDKEKKKIPVKLNYKNKLIGAFRLITNMYSLPRYGEIDPTPIVSILFVIMFGFMLGDIGHGSILLIIGLLLKKKAKELGTIISVASASSILFGFLYGSIFGFEWIPAILVRPMMDIETLMVIAIAFGILVLLLGMILNIINGFSQKNMEKAIFGGEGIAGTVFYTTTLLSVSTYIITKKTFIPPVLLWIILGISLFSIFFAEPLAKTIENLHDKGKNQNKIFPEGFWIVTPISFFNLLIEFFSNTISFVRLAAFALTHEALFSAFWIMTLMVKPTPGGGIWSTMIFLLGQMILVGLEGLVVFIQDLRLTYYEFFTKFFEGNGREFKPFKFER